MVRGKKNKKTQKPVAIKERKSTLTVHKIVPPKVRKVIILPSRPVVTKSYPFYTKL